MTPERLNQIRRRWGHGADPPDRITQPERQDYIDVHELIDTLGSIIACASCSFPMFPQKAGNTADNDAFEICSRCTRVVYTEDLG